MSSSAAAGARSQKYPQAWKKIVKNPLVTKLGRAALNELLQYSLYSKGTSKIKKKKLKRIQQSDIANSLVDMGAECC